MRLKACVAYLTYFEVVTVTLQSSKGSKADKAQPLFQNSIVVQVEATESLTRQTSACCFSV